MNSSMGSTLESFLREEGTYEESVKRVKARMARDLRKGMKAAHSSISTLARDMKTSRSVVQSMLGDGNARLRTLVKAAESLGYDLDIRLRPKKLDSRAG